MASKAAPAGVAQMVRLLVPAGKATASPPIGPALGARGVKSMDFCKEFNARTSHLTPGTPTPVQISIQPDRSFTFTFSSPPTTWLIKQATNLTTASGEAGKVGVVPIATLSLKHAYEIARIKAMDEGLRGAELEGVVRSVVGTAKSMGVNCVP